MPGLQDHGLTYERLKVSNCAPLPRKLARAGLLNLGVLVPVLWGSMKCRWSLAATSEYLVRRSALTRNSYSRFAQGAVSRVPTVAWAAHDPLSPSPKIEEREGQLLPQPALTAKTPSKTTTNQPSHHIQQCVDGPSPHTVWSTPPAAPPGCNDRSFGAPFLPALIIICEGQPLPPLVRTLDADRRLPPSQMMLKLNVNSMELCSKAALTGGTFAVDPGSIKPCVPCVQGVQQRVHIGTVHHHVHH
eukprot:COSAG04_NODE_290_length_17835_cov_11.494982_5_plen_245_part_00